MNNLLRLYPRAWRDRYGDEMLALLTDQPASLLDTLDLMRGALDAHLHPQVRGAAATDQEDPLNHRLLGFMAAIGSIAWLLGFASLFVMPLDSYGLPDSSLAFIAAMLAMPFIGIPLGELGSRADSASSRRTGHVIAIASVVTGVAMLFGWPIFVAALYAFVAIAILGSIRGALNGAFPGWFAAVFVVAAVASLAGFLGGVGQDVAVVFMASLGLGGLALAWIAYRGASADIGTPAPEVGAA